MLFTALWRPLTDLSPLLEARGYRRQGAPPPWFSTPIDGSQPRGSGRAAADGVATTGTPQARASRTTIGAPSCPTVAVGAALVCSAGPAQAAEPRKNVRAEDAAVVVVVGVGQQHEEIAVGSFQLGQDLRQAVLG